MNGSQIGKRQGAVAHLITDAKFFCVNNDRNRSGDALVAASGVDHYRHLTAVHAGIRTSCCHGFCSHTDIVPVHIQKYFSDICAVIIL